ncbi:MAG: pitrilysin family protein [Deinococcaceae bacterium]
MNRSPQFYEDRLPCGLKVIGEYFPNSRHVSIGYFVSVGSRDESLGEEGLAHFIEHMMFKGGSLDALELSRRFDALGADYNAFTDEEMTAYFGQVLVPHALDLQDLILALTDPLFKASDIELERQVILEEIEMYEDQPESRLIDHLRETYFGEHPLGHPILGYRDTVSAFKQEQIQSFHERHYGVSGGLLVVCGNMDWSMHLERARTYVAPTSTFSPRAYPSLKRVGDRHSQLSQPNLSQTHVAMMCPGPSQQEESLSYAAMVLTELISGDTGKLYWSLIHTGRADEAYFIHHEADQIGYFEGYLTSDPEHTEDNLARFREVLNQTAQGDFSDQEIERAKRKLILASVLQNETPAGRLFGLASDYLSCGRFVDTTETIARVQAVQRSDLKRLLEEYPLNVLTTSRLVPDSV